MQWLHQTHPDDDDNDLSLVDYFPDVLIATPVAIGSKLLIEELEPANNETLSSDNPQGDTETSIVLPMKSLLRRLRKAYDVTVVALTLTTMVLKEEVSYDIFQSILFNLYQTQGLRRKNKLFVFLELEC